MKKEIRITGFILSMMVCAVIVMAGFRVNASDNVSIRYGDVDRDGDVDLEDAQAMLRHALKIIFRHQAVQSVLQRYLQMKRGLICLKLCRHSLIQVQI